MELKIKINDPNMDPLSAADYLMFIATQLKRNDIPGISVLASKVKGEDGQYVGAWMIQSKGQAR